MTNQELRDQIEALKLQKELAELQAELQVEDKIPEVFEESDDDSSKEWADLSKEEKIKRCRTLLEDGRSGRFWAIMWTVGLSATGLGLLVTFIPIMIAFGQHGIVRDSKKKLIALGAGYN